jgi:hypothetical protein
MVRKVGVLQFPSLVGCREELLDPPDLRVDGGGGSLMTHKYRGSQQSSREVLPKFIDSTQGEPKNICKP